MDPRKMDTRGLLLLLLLTCAPVLDAGASHFADPYRVVCPAGLTQLDLCLGTKVSSLETMLMPHNLTESLEYARSLLQNGIEIEHSTIPPYLTAMYSIVNTSSWVYGVVRSVVIEEMLHMTTLV